jgi:hypothetical protein
VLLFLHQCPLRRSSQSLLPLRPFCFLLQDGFPCRTLNPLSLFASTFVALCFAMSLC